MNSARRLQRCWRAACSLVERSKSKAGYALTATTSNSRDGSDATSRNRLTKSLFIRGYDCPLRLRHAIDKMPSQQKENQYLRILAEGGFQFEKLVRAGCPLCQ